MRRRTIVIVAVPSMLAGAAMKVFAGDSSPAPMQELARMRPARAFAPRLSIETTYRDCTPHAPAVADTAATIARDSCNAPDERPRDLRALADAADSTDPDSLQASGIAGLIWQNRRDEQALDRVVASLEKARRLSPRRVPLLVDLSAAYLVRAEWGQNSQDLGAAIQHAEDALVLEPRNLSALYNAALAKQALGLDGEASRAWDAYLAVDSTSPWADEARRRRQNLITSIEEIALPAPGAPGTEVSAFADRFPQEAREYGWDVVLRDWGAATIGEDSAACTMSLLRLAEQLGRALEQRDGGDKSLADAVRAIHEVQSDPAAAMVLAGAHRDFGIGRANFEELAHDRAFDALDRVVRARPPSPVLVQWATLYRAAERHYRKDTAQAVRDLAALQSGVDGVRYPALAGRARMVFGGILLQTGEPVASREQYVIAAERFARAGETHNLGTVLSYYGEAVYGYGDTTRAYESMHLGLQALRHHQRSPGLHNNLHGLARFAFLDEMPRAALTILNEDVSVAKRVGTPVRVLDALLARIRVRTAVGDTEGAARDRDSALAWRARIPPDEAQGEWAQARINMLGPANVSTATLDSAVAVLGQNVIWLVPALVQRAETSLAKGDAAGAIRDMETAVRVLEQQSRQSDDGLHRGALLEQARSSFDRLVMLNLRLRRPVDALRALERGRLSLASHREAPAAEGEVRLSPPPGHVALDFGLIGDTLLVWVLRGDTIRVLGQPVDHDAFMQTVEEVNAALESHDRAADAEPGLQQLYDWLIRPVRGYLGPRGTPLVIVADGEVAGVPFPALLDSTRNDYLIRDYPVRHAATLTEAARQASTPWRPGLALLVANPDFDGSRYPGLFPLLDARGEVDAVGRFYPDTVLLEGATATRKAFMAGAQSASVIHYAGHAMFDDARPERSHLVLAGRDTTGRLSAELVSDMRLRGVRLVVLSACRTLRSRQGRSGGFAGLSEALLRAGAGGVVGSLWEVKDDRTTPLMREFHAEYSRSGNAADALRTAQLKMLDSGDPRLSSPATWAGFRYTGAGQR